jgi:hypothetical protein
MAKHAFWKTCRSRMEVIGPEQSLVSGLLPVGTWFCDLKDLGHYGRASSHERGALIPLLKWPVSMLEE